MNIKGFRRMLFGENMPDKNAPENKERYERDVNAGKKFAKAMRIDKAAFSIQSFAIHHRRAFLTIVIGFMLACFAWNVYRLMLVYNHKPPQQTATERQDSILRNRHMPINHKMYNSQPYEYENNREN